MKLKENFTIRKVAGRNVLVPFSAAAAAGKKMSVAEISGSSVWLLDQLKGREFSFGEAAGLISERYDVTVERALADVEAFFGNIRNLGILDD